MKKIISNLVLVFFLFHCTEKKKANLLPIALLGGLTTITTTQIANSSPDQNDTGSNSSSGSSSITTSATVA
ncbi:MAG: hypothetical protein SFU98_09835, partial [Leptospiraceae bacterium]|nr:hypothetical protein [Leptospiraceae bacterium]